MKKVLTILFYGIISSFILLSNARASTFAVISDVRANALDIALEFITSQAVDFIIVPGDFYYDAQDYYSHFVKYGFEATAEMAPDQQNIYFVMGNHDSLPFGDPTFRNLIAPYYPENGPVSAPQGTVFSFDQNNCHFVITNQYWNYPSGGYTEEQLNWIRQDLAASDQPFKFVFGHEPAFPLERHIGDSLDADPTQRDVFWNILGENGVQAFFCGHTHNLSYILYKGIYQIDNGQVRGSTARVTIVDVSDTYATFTSYHINELRTISDSTRHQASNTVSQVNPVAETDIDLNALPENNDSMDVLYSEGSSSNFLGTNCFISILFF